MPGPSTCRSPRNFLRAGELEQAVRIFQKILEMDPENVAMRVRLAEVYIRLGKKNDAWDIFSAAAESLRARGSFAAAGDIVQRMLALDPGNSYVLLMRARTALESDDSKAAIQYFEKVADLDSHPDGMRDLLKAYLSVGKLNCRGTAGDKLFAVHNDMDGIVALADALMHNGGYQQALELNQPACRSHAGVRLGQSSDQPARHHQSRPRNTLPHWKFCSTCSIRRETRRTSARSRNSLPMLRCNRAIWRRPRDLYQSLALVEPQNPMHMKNYEQVVERMGGTTGTRLITAEEGAVMVDELEATAPMIEQQYPDADAVAIRSAFTDADLFLSTTCRPKRSCRCWLFFPEHHTIPGSTNVLRRCIPAPSDFRKLRLAAACSKVFIPRLAILTRQFVMANWLPVTRSAQRLPPPHE